MKTIKISFIVIFLFTNYLIAGTYSGIGDGSSGNPYQIATTNHLIELSNTSGDWGSHFIQTADITFDENEQNVDWDGDGSATWDTEDQLGFSSIGESGFLSPSFSGTYDGGGYRIFNLYINNPNSGAQGLFGYLESAEIKNLGLDNADVTGLERVGILCGHLSASTISYSYAEGSVASSTEFSGEVGGLVGHSNDGTITNSFANASVYSSYNSVGGLCGIALISTISNCYSIGKVTGLDYVGGLIGHVQYGSSITNSFSTGVVLSTAAGTNVGGLIGRDAQILTTVNNSFWNTETSSQSSSDGGTGKTTDEMLTESTFTNAGWDFTNTWSIDAATSYPYLQSNEQTPHPVPPIYFDGSVGTAKDPFQISTAQELDSVRYFLNYYFIQTTDIDLDVAPYNTGSGWEPIGTNGSGNWFEGNYDGDGYTISNLFINRSGTDFVGLFGSIYNGEIKDLALEDVDITGDDWVGALVGLSYSDITMCYSTGDITGTQYIGGLVGQGESYQTSTASITNSYSSGNVLANSDGGGLLGRLASGTVSNSYSSGYVNNGGGLMSINTGTVTNSYWNTDFSGQSTSAGGTSLTTSQMKAQANFTSWDFSTVWSIDEGSSFPYLQSVEESPHPPGHPFAAGAGTQASPFQISSPTDLNNVRNYMSSYFIQKADIDLDVAPYNTGSGWEPIGTNGSGNWFEGNYDGDGYTISNLFINRSGTDFVGLFGSIYNGEIKDLALEDVDITGDDWVGALVGLSYSDITMCYSTGDITGTQYIGGLVGQSESYQTSTASITNSYSSGSVSANSDGGGLLGRLASGTVTNSYSSGFVNNGGGLLSVNGGTVTNSYWNTETSGQSASAGGTDLNSIQMVQETNFTGFDFSSTWTINEGVSYPYLQLNPQTTPPSPGQLFSGGDGSSSTPYLVANTDDLNNLRYALDKEFKQTADIDLDVAPYNTGSGWEPIGTNGSGNWFEGNYDGDGYTISNLFINRSGTDFVGLFGSIYNGEIKDLALEDVDITGDDWVGALVGLSYSGITRCYSTGDITGTQYIGGLVGQSESYQTSTSSITNSYSSVNITANSDGGGLLGRLASGTVTNSYSSGFVNNGGGLLSVNGGTVTNSYWNTDFSGQSASDGGTGITSSQMKMESTFSSWNFSTDWSIDEGSSFPYLQSVEETPHPPGHPFAAGVGTQASPFQISSPTDLNNIRNYMSSYFIQINNIDLDVAPYNTGSGWEPIGTNSVGSEFRGNYDGDGYTISNLFIDRSGTDFVGLFGSIYNGEIKDLALEDVDITGDDWVGALVGLSYSGITRCYSTGDITGTQYIGGLVGQSESYQTSTSSITNSYSSVNITANSDGGGLLGRLASGTVTNSYSSGFVNNGGGLLGVYNSGTISNSFWDKATSGQTTSGGSETGKTTTEMKTESTFTNAGWDFTNVWEMIGESNEDYPKLQSSRMITVSNIGNSFADADNRFISFQAQSGTIAATFEYIDSSHSTEPGGARSVGVYWEISNVTGNTKIRLYYTAAQKAAFTGTPKIYHYTGGNWVELPTEAEEDIDGTNFYVQTTNYYSSFSPVTVGDDAAPLPVELTFFEGYNTEEGVVLNWETATETNNYGFEVQKTEVRSQNSEWTKVGFVQGYGTTNSPKDYEFTDSELPNSEEVSYRLKQIDNDGTFAYSKTIDVDLTTITGVEGEEIPIVYSLSQNYPNPFNPSTTIKFGLPEQGYVDLRVYNMLGQEVARLISEEMTTGYHEVNFGNANLASGMYIYQLNVGDKFTSIKKMLMVK